MTAKVTYQWTAKHLQHLASRKGRVAKLAYLGRLMVQARRRLDRAENDPDVLGQYAEYMATIRRWAERVAEQHQYTDGETLPTRSKARPLTEGRERIAASPSGRPLWEIVQELLADLSTDERYVVARRYGLDGQDRQPAWRIAQQLGVSQPTVERILRRARTTLRVRYAG